MIVSLSITRRGNFMTGTEIITFLSNNLSTVMSPINLVVGGLLTSIFLRHDTSVTEFEKIKSGQFKEVTKRLLESGKMTYIDYYQSNNFLEIAKKADKYYSEIHSDSRIDETTNQDFDWYVRFYQAAGNVSDETMQDLWAKLLAGEVSKPSTYSFKTIDVLKNLSKKDAELFQQVCSYSFCNASQIPILPRYDGYLEKYNITYSDILTLSEQGLIFNDGTIGQSVNINNESKVLFWDTETVMTIQSADGKDIKAYIREYPFTKVGYEISSLVPVNLSDEKYIEFATQISNKNKNYLLGVYKVIALNGTSIRHDSNNLL